jgi:hypothetical protein
MPLIINGNCKKGALFYYFCLMWIFPGTRAGLGSTREMGNEQKRKAISAVRPTPLYLVTVALRMPFGTGGSAVLLLEEIASTSAPARLLAMTFSYTV